MIRIREYITKVPREDRLEIIGAVALVLLVDTVVATGFWFLVGAILEAIHAR